MLRCALMAGTFVLRGAFWVAAHSYVIAVRVKDRLQGRGGIG